MSSPSSRQKHYLDDIRRSYDTLAEEYAKRIYHELAGKPFDRELLDNFAVRVRGQGQVCDFGCGPGHVGRYLFEHGADVSGLDLSPRMIGIARSLNPRMTFRTGNMLALDLSDWSLRAITAFYAIVNLPPDSIERAFREMYRVLQPGGLLLLDFHVGNEILHEEELWDLKISMDFYMLNTKKMTDLLEKTGFHIEQATEREPYPEVEYPSRRAYILAQKPA